MELALQVVGLKMTGKIEDAKNVAMRIVGNAGGDNSESNHNNNSNTGMMQLGASPAVRPLFSRGFENSSDFEKSLIDFLAVLDTPLGSSAPNSLLTQEAVSHLSSTGHSLLHLAAFKGLSLLTSFLIDHGADLDARDRNGFTPLHFATLSGSKACASALLAGGADPEIVDSLGKTPEEISTPGFFEQRSPFTDSDSDGDRTEDEDADLGDAEEDDDVPIRRMLNRRVSRRLSRLNLSGRGTPRRSVDVSRSATPPPMPSNTDKLDSNDKKTEDDLDTADAKRAASFMEKMIQRTLAQIPATQGIIPNMPQLPLPHLPDLPAVPWGSLPQLPMVFPVFIPMMPGWPSFFGGEPGANNAAARLPGQGDGPPHMGAVALRAAQEWRATWEKWVALAVATTARQQTEDLPPPVYTPHPGEDEATQLSSKTEDSLDLQDPVPSTSRVSSEIRPVGYDSTPVPDQVVESFGYQHTPKQKQKKRKNRFCLSRPTIIH